MHSLSIVVPAYNEEANLSEAVRRVSDVAQDLGLDYEIIIVNDGSRDRTGDIARELLSAVPNLKLVKHFPNRGYGGALKAGFAAATKDLIAFTPADNQFDFGEIRLLLDKLTPDVAMVSGRRIDRKDNLIRKFNGFGWNTVVRLLFGYLIKDIDCGFKVFRRSILDHIHVESNGAMIDTEMLAEMRARRYQIAEAPVTHLPRTAGSPTGANLKVVVRAFRDLFRFRLRLWRELREEKRAAGTNAKRDNSPSLDGDGTRMNTDEHG
jgi:glycosyltransferase involved in cell wall biosynthesis